MRLGPFEPQWVRRPLSGWIALASWLNPSMPLYLALQFGDNECHDNSVSPKDVGVGKPFESQRTHNSRQSKDFYQ